MGFGKFRFDFKTEEELEAVLKQQPFHFDYWMLSLARWQPKQSKSFPSEIKFWVRVIGLPLEFRTVSTFESIGGALGRVVAVDVTLNRVQVVVDAFKELCFETTVDFKGGEFYDGEEAAVSLRYEKLFGFCKLCGSLCHKEELCPLDEKNAKASPERRREIREGIGGWYDGTKHEERARSYKGVVINGHTGQQHKERESREYYGKGKGKIVDAADSKWVKVAERGSRKPPPHHGYRGEGEGSRYKNMRRDDGRHGVTGGGFGIRPSSEQSRDDQRQRIPASEAQEDGEIKSNGDEGAILPSEGFQIELAKTQAGEAEKGLITLQGMMEKQDYMAEDIDMELEAINATILESGVEVEAEEEFQTLSEEEAEQASEVEQEYVHTQEEEELLSGDADADKDMAAGVVATRQSNRKRLAKPSISTAGSNKKRMASVLLSPRKRAAVKVGTRHGDSGKPTESKGPSNPKPVNLKF